MTPRGIQRVLRIVGKVILLPCLLVTGVSNGLYAQTILGCPGEIPVSAQFLASYFPGYVPTYTSYTFNVPWEEHPQTKIPFTPTELAITELGGHPWTAWYMMMQPDEVSYDAHSWQWALSGIHHTCMIVSPLFMKIFPTPGIAVRGFAVMIGGEGETCGGGGEGGGEGETLRADSKDSLASIIIGSEPKDYCGGTPPPDCWDVWDWWVDSSGYHEQYRGQYCDGEEWEI